MPKAKDIFETVSTNTLFIITTKSVIHVITFKLNHIKDI